MDRQRRLNEWITGHQHRVGIALVLFFGAGSSIALSSLEVSGSERPEDLLAYLLVWIVSLGAYWYRTKPLAALAVSVAFMLGYWVLDYPGSAEPAVWFLFYSATRHGGDDRTLVWRVIGALLGAITIVATIGVIVSTEDLPAFAIPGVFILHGTFAAIGEALYQRARYIEQLEQRATDLEADLENRSALAASEERTRIAREMHDIIAHGMSTVVVQAQAAQSVVETNPEKAREVLRTIENIGRTSVDEMRRMLGVLRSDDGDAELEPQPGLEQLDELRNQFDVDGVQLELTVTGDLEHLSPGLDLTGYRVVQEALTNVLRHAGRPVVVTATVHHSDHELNINIVDNGLGAGASPETAGTGYGLRGMQERVDAYDGTLRCGPIPGGGFGVQATFPVTAKVLS